MANNNGEEWRNKNSILYFQRLLRLLLELLLSVNDISNIYSMFNNIVIVMYRVSLQKLLTETKISFLQICVYFCQINNMRQDNTSCYLNSFLLFMPVFIHRHFYFAPVLRRIDVPVCAGFKSLYIDFQVHYDYYNLLSFIVNDIF